MKRFIIYGILFISGVYFVKDIYPNISIWHAYPQPQRSRTTLAPPDGISVFGRNSSSEVHHIRTEEMMQPHNDIKYQRNAYLKKECYAYSNVTAINTCCKMHQYTVEDLLFCAAKTLKIKERLSIVFVGDSRIRQIFNSFGYLLRNTTMTYAYGGNHGSIRYVLQGLMYQYPHTNITITSKELPLDIYFHWDPYLNKLFPKLLKQWIANPWTQPNLLIIESGTHPLSDNDILEAFGIFEQIWRDLLPSLSTLAETTHTVVKMMDHVQVGTQNSKSRLSNENINYINSILQSLLEKHSNNILEWNSNINLEDLYVQQCYKKQLSTRDLMWWCEDTFHIGYIVIHQLRNMILNSYCNKYLPPGDDYSI